MTQKFCSHCGNEILPQTAVCPHCGCAVATVSETDVPSTGLNVISFFIPIVGLVLYLVHHDKAPQKAKAIGKYSLIGFCVSLLLVVFASVYINYESPEERARREINEAIGRVEESRNRLDDLQRQQDYIQGLIDLYEK
jgi:predicted amidophosphoribosyltransferase